MNFPLIPTRRLSAILFFRLLACVLLLILSFIAASAQSATDGSTPLGLSPGAPAGSYAMSDFESVNLYNGTLSFQLPLLKIAGRGGAGYAPLIRLEQKWLVNKFREEVGQPYVYMAEPNWWNEDGGGMIRAYTAGGMHIRQGHSEQFDLGCNGVYVYRSTLTRLTFTAPNGTEYDLRDQATNGQPVWQAPCGSAFNRGKVFVTSDGSAATYVSDTDITDIYYDDLQDYDLFGYLILRDGTRFRIDAGKISWMRDRNGNKVTFTEDNFQRLASITDSLNRQVTITYATTSVPYDQINFKGFGGAARTLRVGQTNLGNVLRSDFTLQTPQQLFPQLSASVAAHNPTVFSYVELPDGRRYQFQYNSYGEVARVVLPTGGAVEYDYAAGLTDGVASGVFSIGTDKYIYRRVIERRMYPDGGTGTAYASKTTYSRPETTTTNAGYVVSDTLSSTGALLGRSKHYFYGSPRASFGQKPTEYPGWKDAREYRTETFDTNGTTLISRVEHTLAQRAAVSWWTGATDAEPPNDPRVTQTVTTLADTNQVTKQTFTYDQYNNQTDVYEYNYGTGVAGSLVRRTHTDYVTDIIVGGVTYNYDSDTTIHLRSLPEQTSVYDAAGVEQARTTFEYDNYTATANHAALVARTGISGLDSAFTTSKKTRGNTTGVTHYVLTNGAVTSSISSYQQYDVAGNAVKTIDGRGYQTTFNFSDRFGSPDAEARLNSGATELGTQQSYAFPGLVTNALSQTIYTQRDYYTGLVVDVEDSNGVTSSAYYADELDRPTQVIRAADDTTLRSQTSFSYDDTNKIITTTSDLSAYGDNLLKSQMLYDGLGRTIETRQYETATAYITTKQTYDAMGKPSQSSNPYRAGQSVLWTTTTYDALGRTKSVKTPDNATVNTSYSGNTVTVTDQAGKDRKSTTDALGRLTQIVEDPGTGGLGYITTYAYDVLDNLKTVTQSGQQNGQTITQTRTFTYDSLSRLVSAANPESGTISYVYDANGNLTLKTDARSISTTITYDALNRPTLKNYSDTTPDVRYFYDAQTLPTGAPTFVRGASVGRLVAVTTGGTSAGGYYGYDGLGRVLRRIQQTDSINYLADATYNKMGAMLTETYPTVPGATDRRTVTYSFDTAGRLSSLATAATTYSAFSASVSNISYAAHGGLSSETLGNNLVHALTYNTRLQPTQIKLGTTAAPTSVLNLTYNYGTTANNGNILDVTNRIGTWTTKQIYTYDALNRLDSTQETNGSTTTYWTEDDAYDRFGNRWEVNGGIPSLTFNSQNRIVGYTYDAAGNVTNDTSGLIYAYDAENRIKTVAGVANTYVYDGEGKRVKKYFPQGEQVRFVYGVSGQLIMEFETTNGGLRKEYVYGSGGLLATIDATNGTRYTTSDHLGSPRVVTGSTGAVVSRHDYRSFGRELLVGEGGRTAAQGFGAGDGLRQQFTGKERDGETGLDYFLARYYSPAHGRFTSTDPVVITPNRLSDPQQLNQYAYVRNNPLRFIDPTGEMLTISGDVNEALKQLREMLGAEFAESRVDVDEETNTITVDLSGIDLEKNEAAKLLDQLVTSDHHYDLTIGSTVETRGGTTETGLLNTNLTLNDERFKNDKTGKYKPREGIDAQIAVDVNAILNNRKSKTDLKTALPSMVVFHELAEAYAKVENNKQYDAAHKDAAEREQKLRDQRPYLKEYNPGSGPGDQIIIKK